MDIFRNPTKSLPKQADDQTVRIDFSKQDLGRPPPAPPPARDLGISHIPNKG